jgi:hypothetical protein
LFIFIKAALVAKEALLALPAQVVNRVLLVLIAAVEEVGEEVPLHKKHKS